MTPKGRFLQNCLRDIQVQYYGVVLKNYWIWGDS